MNQEIAALPKSYAVLIIDMAHYRETESELLISGFPSREEAIEYARRRLRSSVEELRAMNQSAAELRRLWSIYGEDAMVIEEAGYKGSSELDFFIAHPASAEEQDWQAIEKRLGKQLIKRIAD
ncbi:MAG: hypothetical protein AB1757_16855 [Acidobacteriota bacterium]